jgi:opacity protein-like surface antigen
MQDDLTREDVDMECEKMMRRLDKWTAKVGFQCLVAGMIMVFTTGVAGAGFRFRLNVDYVSGLHKLADQYDDDIEVQEDRDFPFAIVEVDDVVIPVGISLFPYWQWDNGLMLGVGIGPAAYFLAEGLDENFTHWEVPLNVCVGYTFFLDGPVSPYIRVGPSYHLAGGDFYESSKLGIIVAGGVELLKTDHFVMGLEVAYDSASVEVDVLSPLGPSHDTTRDIRTTELIAGVFFQFQ